MDRLAGVAQGFLGESFRKPADFGPFGPGISVAVERDPRDTQERTAPLELFGAMFLVHQGDSGEQEPLLWQLGQDFRDACSEMELGDRAGFVA